jgi:hypothetical protein
MRQCKALEHVQFESISDSLTDDHIEALPRTLLHLSISGVPSNISVNGLRNLPRGLNFLVFPPIPIAAEEFPSLPSQEKIDIFN